MANTQMPFGLKPLRHLFGGTIRENEYAIADQYGTGLYLGDPVLCTGTGVNVGIASAGNSDVVTGVFNGCKYIDLLGNTIWSKYWPASTATLNAVGATALIYDDPFILYQIQFDATGFINTGVRSLANLHSGTGNTQTGQSGWYASAPAGGANQLKIYKLASYTFPGAIQNAYGAYAVAEVTLGTPELVATAPVSE